MTPKKGDFSDDVKLKCLLWSDRHCCLCGKQCGINIEIHHIIPKAKIKDKEKPVISIMLFHYVLIAMD